MNWKIGCILILLFASAARPQTLPSHNVVRFYLPGEEESQQRTTDESSTSSDESTSAITVSPPAMVSLDGEWDFYYDGVSEGKKRNVSYAMKEPVPELPTPESYETTLPVPAYWDDHLPRLQNTSWWFWAQFNSNYRKIDFPMGNKWVPP